MEIACYFDGDEPEGFRETVEGFRKTWCRFYAPVTLTFRPPVNMKTVAGRAVLPAKLKAIADVRNPDFFFHEVSKGVELGGIETTTHSPDGSNVEKRYPYLWISRRSAVDGLIASPLLKARAGGQVNRLPFRHLKRNLAFLEEWDPADRASPLCQIVPVRELMGGDLDLVPRPVQGLLPGWRELGAFFAHRLANATLPAEQAQAARRELVQLRDDLETLMKACQRGTTDTEPSTLIKEPRRWIQVYNCRPDSGHWERGEGQFDSIDGRLMFTLNELENQRPRPSFEFWLPQMVSVHPWIGEQVQNGHGSKRLRNILRVLAPYCTTRFADELTQADWELLERNPKLLLERLDWPAGIYRVGDLVPAARRSALARNGLSKKSEAMKESIEAVLREPALHFSSHRAYEPGWQVAFGDALAGLRSTAQVLVPRIPARLLAAFMARRGPTLVPAEACSKAHLLTLRQLHRARGGADSQ